MRFFYLALVLVGISLLLTAGGFHTPVVGGILNGIGLINNDTINNQALNSSLPTYLNNTVTYTNIKDSTFWNDFNILLAAVVATGIALSFFGRTPDTNILLAGLVGLLSAALLADYLSIYIRLLEFNVEWISWVGTFIFGTIIVGIFITALDFWRGSD